MLCYLLDPPEAEVCGMCSDCCEYICEGDEIVEFAGGVYHKSCFWDNAAGILLAHGDAFEGVAEARERYG